MTLSIVVPVFNEVKCLEHVISNWSKYLIQKKITHEFVICEDGSTDGTKELIKKLEKIYFVSNQSVEKRRGYGQGVISGVIAAKYEYILCIDSDGQCMPDSFEEFFTNKDVADILIGNRNPRRDPKIRIIYSKLFKLVHDYLFDSRIKDPSCPYVLAKKDIYKMLINKLGLLNYVAQVSGSDEILAAYYKNARALIYPSTYEGFGLPPLEAMGLGCPVLVSSAPPLPEVVENAGLYFNPNSSDELFGCMQRVLSETERAHWSVKGMEQSRKFQWSKMAEQLLSFYKQLLKAE